MRKWIFAFFLFLLLFLFFLPQIASTSLGKPFFMEALSHKTECSIQAEALSFSWFGPQKFHRLAWTRNEAYGTIEELEIEAPFWSFSGPFRLKNGTLHYQRFELSAINGQIEGNDFDLQGISSEGAVSLKGSIDRENQFDLTLNAPIIKTHLKGKRVNGGFTLSEPVIATIHLNPRLFPLFLAPAPVTLRIEPNDFFFPLPYTIEKLSIGNGMLDLGKVRYQNSPSVEAILTLFKINPKQMEIWFTPISFNVHEGALTIDRVDFLIDNSIHLCGWGKVDLVKERLKMILGLPSDTLRKIFGIKNLPEKYVLKVDVRGTIKQPDIATGPASAKIGAMIAAKQIPKKGIWGGLADIFITPQDDKETPPPKKPFPWSTK